MKKHSLVLAALVSLAATAGAANGAMDEMDSPEMRVWKAVLSEPDEEAAGATLMITASQSTTGSNSLVIESVAIVSTGISKDDEGNVTETMSSVECAGPFPVEGRRSFMVEAAPVDEGEMAEAGEADAEMAEAGEAETEGTEGCAFAVSGELWHTYRTWHSWDMSGQVTMGETTVEFSIADPAPAMVLEPEPEEEMPDEAMSREGEAAA